MGAASRPNAVAALVSAVAVGRLRELDAGGEGEAAADDDDEPDDTDEQAFHETHRTLCRPHPPLVFGAAVADAGRMIRIGSIVWGVRDFAPALDFWTSALDYRPVREPDADWAILAPVAGRGPQLALKLVGSETNPSPRHHLDLYAADQDAEVERLIELGATRVEWEYEEGADYIVLADPDGNRFCVVDAGEAAAPPE